MRNQYEWTQNQEYRLYRQCSSLPPVVCRRTYVVLCCLCLFVYCDVQYFVIYYVFMFWVACCDVCYDFRIKTMFGSSLPPVVLGGLMSYLRYLWFFLLHRVVSNTYCVVFFVSFFFVLSMLPVSLDCPFVIAPSVFSNVYSNI